MTRVVILLASLISLIRPAQAQVGWRGDFETGALEGFSDPIPKRGVSVVSEPVAPGGFHAAKIVLDATGPADMTGLHRVELRHYLPPALTREGATRFFGASFFVPKTLNADAHELLRVLSARTGKTLFAFIAKGDRVDLRVGDMADKSFYGGETSRLSAGRWHTVVLGVRFSGDATKGRLDCWYDGDKMINHVATVTRDGEATLVLAAGLGKSTRSVLPETIVVDELAEAARLSDLRPVRPPSALGKWFPDVVYARPGGEPLGLDGWVPDGPGPHPVVILVHGGGFIRGDKQSYVRPLFELLAQAGFAWFSIDHRLAPQAKWPKPLDDVEAAVAWVHKNARKYRLDRKRIALLGESAGGFLVSAAGVRAKPGVLAAVLPFYTFHEFALPAPGPGAVIPVPTTGVFADLFGIKDTSARTQATLRAAMPIHNLRKNLPPFLLYHGKKDLSVPYTASLKMCEAMKAVGATCDLLIADDLGHGLNPWVQSPGWGPQVISWLRRVMPGS